MRLDFNNDTAYNVEDFTCELPLEEYINNFRNQEKFLEACKSCSNFNNRWGCPPFDYDVEKMMAGYHNIKLYATRITPIEQGLPLDLYDLFLAPEKERVESMLLAYETKCNGRAFCHVGKCRFCAETPCARLDHKPCRHPDKVRPSLESFGFDITKTLNQLFGITIHWSKDGKMPPYLMLVCAVIY